MYNDRTVLALCRLLDPKQFHVVKSTVGQLCKAAWSGMEGTSLVLNASPPTLTKIITPMHRVTFHIPSSLTRKLDNIVDNDVL